MMRIIFLILILLIPAWTMAASSDKQQTAYVNAHQTTLNYKKRTGIYIGNVKMTQGTTTILADKVITYFNQDNQLEKAIATGNLASYTTLPDNSKLPFTAAGQTINYYPLQGYVELIGRAKATQGKDSLAGPHLKYDINQQTVVSLPEKTGHTTIIIQPDQKLSQ